MVKNCRSVNEPNCDDYFTTDMYIKSSNCTLANYTSIKKMILAQCKMVSAFLPFCDFQQQDVNPNEPERMRITAHLEDTGARERSGEILGILARLNTLLEKDNKHHNKRQ